MFDLLLNHVIEIEGNNVQLNEDYFWSIPTQALYNVYEQAPEPTVGQLSESWNHLDEVLKDDSKVLSYHLVWLSDILRAIGGKIVR